MSDEVLEKPARERREGDTKIGGIAADRLLSGIGREALAGDVAGPFIEAGSAGFGRPSPVVPTRSDRRGAAGLLPGSIVLMMPARSREHRRPTRSIEGA